LFPDTKSKFAEEGQYFSGEYLMKIGLSVSPNTPLTSNVYEVIAE